MFRKPAVLTIAILFGMAMSVVPISTARAGANDECFSKHVVKGADIGMGGYRMVDKWIKPAKKVWPVYIPLAIVNTVGGAVFGTLGAAAGSGFGAMDELTGCTSNN